MTRNEKPRQRNGTGYAPGVTLAAVLSLLRPNENVFIMRRINQHKEEAIGGGRVRELQALNKYVKMYGGCEVERMELELTADDLPEEWETPDTPILAITIRERED